MALPTSVDVAIVGAGPTGLASACILRNQGVDVLVLDAATQPFTASRAAVIHLQTLETLEDLGISKTLVEKGLKPTRWDVIDKTGTLVNIDFSRPKAKYPDIVTLDQSETESTMHQRLVELGGSVCRGAEVTGITQSDDVVCLEINFAGAKSSVHAQYVIAADGYRSRIRQNLGIDFQGGEYAMTFMAADVKLSNNGRLRRDSFLAYLGIGGFMLFIPLPHNVWRIAASGVGPPKDANIDFYQKLVSDQVDPDIRLSELVWKSHFHIHHRLASHYRQGRIFLAGDAAHVHSPAGGQGMNISIQDGCRLGEILAEALQGKSSDADLDRYETERRPVGERVLAMTHRITTIGTLKSPVLCVLRNWFLWATMTVLPFLKDKIALQISKIGHR
jgi:2-polyprenyl-6-methoxyphenol hydroxylase-like FAD-dependent oxidoreductase